MKRFQAPETCPVCGVLVPEDALACPECGADERTGWSDEARAQSLGLPDEGFDYDEFVAREFGGRVSKRRHGRFWWWVAIGALVVFLWTVFGGLL